METSNKQTAVEWLQVQLNENGKLSAVDFYQAKEMEKQQIIDAWKDGYGGDAHDKNKYFDKNYGK